MAFALLTGICLYIAMNVLSALLDSDAPLPQQASDASLLVIYIIIGFGIYRLGLFDVDRWVLGAWILFLCGLATLVVDALVVYTLDAQGGRTAAVVLTLLAWAYFPLRQFIWLRLTRRLERRDFRDLAPTVLERLLQQDEAHLSESWPVLLRRVFAPLRISRSRHYEDEVQIAKGGTELWLPEITGSPPLVLSYADRGNRLFTREDRRLAELLAALIDDIRRFRDAVDIGAREERLRIARSLHDEITPPMLTLIYKAPPGETADSFRALFRQLHDIVQDLRNREAVDANLRTPIH
jgi:signal transduction histidine kinase